MSKEASTRAPLDEDRPSEQAELAQDVSTIGGPHAPLRDSVGADPREHRRPREVDATPQPTRAAARAGRGKRRTSAQASSSAQEASPRPCSKKLKHGPVATGHAWKSKNVLSPSEHEYSAFLQRCVNRFQHVEMSVMKRTVQELRPRLELKTKQAALNKLRISVKAHDEFTQRQPCENAENVETDFIAACAKRLGDRDLTRVRSYVQETRAQLKQQILVPASPLSALTKLDAVAKHLHAENAEIKAAFDKLVAVAKAILGEAVPDDQLAEKLGDTFTHLKTALSDCQAQIVELERRAAETTNKGHVDCICVVEELEKKLADKTAESEQRLCLQKTAEETLERLKTELFDGQARIAELEKFVADAKEVDDQRDEAAHVVEQLKKDLAEQANEFDALKRESAAKLAQQITPTRSWESESSVTQRIYGSA